MPRISEEPITLEVEEGRILQDQLAHDGRIHMESEVGVGTTAWAELLL